MQLGLDGAFTDYPETQHNYLECRNNINASNPTNNPNATILVSADSPGGPINASQVFFGSTLIIGMHILQVHAVSFPLVSVWTVLGLLAC